MDLEKINKSKILVVDDEKMNLMILSEILEGGGFTNFETTNDPEEGLDRLKKNNYDLLLLDLLMPKLNGKELINRLNHFRPDHNVSIIILSSVVDKKVTNYMLSNAGAADYMTKPFDNAEFLARVRKTLQNRINIEDLEDLVKDKARDIVRSHVAFINALSNAANYKDNESAGHIKRIGAMSREVALELGWSENKVKMIETVAPLHDIGKIGIPDIILTKEEPLTQAEKLVLQKHTIIGASLILGSATTTNEMIQMTANIALNHHEKWDGSGGYPRRLKGEEIPIEARIVSIVDVFDTMVVRGMYDVTWTPERTFQFIRSNSGKQFDPEVVSAFVQAFPRIMEISEQYSESFEDDKEKIKQIEKDLEL